MNFALTASATWSSLRFRGVDHNLFPRRSFELHVFLLPHAQAKDFVFPPTHTVTEFTDTESYAGAVGVFGGKDEGCTAQRPSCSQKSIKPYPW